MAEQKGNPPTQYDLSAIDQVTLTPVLRRALGHETIEISDWNYSRFYGAGDVGAVLSGVYRFTGKARDQDKKIEWSLIFKVVGTTAGSDDPSEPRYWKREVQAYQSGQLANLPGGLATPRFFGTIEFSEKVVGLWLEDIVDEISPNWTLKQYGLVARHLGQFNGSFLTKQALPTWPWLSQGWVREHVSGKGPKFDHLSQSLDLPLTRRWFIDDDAKTVLRLWEERELFLDAYDRLPQTLLHRDAHRDNLFLRQTEDGNGQIVAVDWAFAGIGAIGEELTSLVQATLCFSKVDIAEARQFDKIVFEGYLAGLAEAGWRDDPRLVRLGYTAGSILTFGLGYGLFQLDEGLFPWYEQAFGLPIDGVMALFAEQNHFLLELADEARTLLAVIERRRNRKNQVASTINSANST